MVSKFATSGKSICRRDVINLQGKLPLKVIPQFGWQEQISRPIVSEMCAVLQIPVKRCPLSRLHFSILSTVFLEILLHALAIIHVYYYAILNSYQCTYSRLWSLEILRKANQEEKAHKDSQNVEGEGRNSQGLDQIHQGQARSRTCARWRLLRNEVLLKSMSRVDCILHTEYNVLENDEWF